MRYVYVSLVAFLIFFSFSDLKAEEKSMWNMDIDENLIPNKPASGLIHGNNFAYEKAIIKKDVLTLRQGKEFFPDLGLMIFLFSKDEPLEGKKYIIKQEGEGTVPHIHMKWKPQGKKLPKTIIFSRDYAMYLEFGHKEDGKIPGKIYLSLPDYQKSFVIGTFEAEVE